MTDFRNSTYTKTREHFRITRKNVYLLENGRFRIHNFHHNCISIDLGTYIHLFGNLLFIDECNRAPDGELPTYIRKFIGIPIYNGTRNKRFARDANERENC